MQSIKHAYAHTMRGLGAKLHASGILCPDSVSVQGDLERWIHSLFAINDIDAMIRLDLPWWTLRSVKLVDRFLSSRPQARGGIRSRQASSAAIAMSTCTSSRLTLPRHALGAFPGIRRGGVSIFAAMLILSRIMLARSTSSSLMGAVVIIASTRRGIMSSRMA
jgi:hypothetical protein